MFDLPMTCAQARRLNHLELDGALSADQSQALRAHCEQCPHCRRDRQTLFALQADLIRARFQIAVRKAGLAGHNYGLRSDLFVPPSTDGQMSLF